MVFEKQEIQLFNYNILFGNVNVIYKLLYNKKYK